MSSNGPLLRALESLQRRRGPLDEFIARELGISIVRVAHIFRREQADAFALLIDNRLRGGAGIMLGNAIEIGQAPVLAAAILHSVRQARISIVLAEAHYTLIDILCRLERIISPTDHISSLITIGGAAIPNEVRDRLVHYSSEEDVERALEGAELGHCNALFMTCAQLSRHLGAASSDSRNATLLARIASESDLLIERAPDTNIHDALWPVVGAARSLVCFSADHLSWQKKHDLGLPSGLTPPELGCEDEAGIAFGP